MTTEKHVVIVMPNPSERRSLGKLLREEGFQVETCGNMRDFSSRVNLSACGCLIIDDALFQHHLPAQTAPEFARHWSQSMPVILLASDDATLRQIRPFAGLPKSAPEHRLLYLVYGALGQSTPLLS